MAQWPYGLFALLLMLLSGCVTTDNGSSRRLQRAQTLAADAGLSPVYFAADRFTLAGWMRVRQPQQPLVVYVEGDGKAWLDRHTLSPDPTPENAMGLQLAVLDGAPNLLYLARPCQYVGTKGACSNSTYWSRRRFSPEVIAAMDSAIGQAKEKAQARSVHLVGFSGGGAVVVLVAAGRNDVASIQTVAGNLDSSSLHEHHKVTPLYGSLEPLNTAAFLANIPQIHYAGKDDRVVPPFISQNYQKISGRNGCSQRKVLSGVDHLHGWTSIWPQLLTSAPVCQSKMVNP